VPTMEAFATARRRVWRRMRWRLRGRMVYMAPESAERGQFLARITDC